jgi:membrane protein YqaA with SNARE-associated domain
MTNFRCFGPRSLIRTTTLDPVKRLTTRTRDPNGSLRCPAVNAPGSAISPFAVRPRNLYQTAIPLSRLQDQALVTSFMIGSTVFLFFGLIFGLNVIPAFAPPTWMLVTFIGFEFPTTNTVLLALVAAIAATLGRITLAKLSRWLIREKLLSDLHRKNIDIIKERLEKRAVLTVSVFLFYALSPLPSNFLFIAYGLTGLPLLRIALPFLIGRTASYSFFILSGAAAGRAISFL